ncbi:MAG: TonB-dependent receptor, partial [Bacteroidota bacterium]|nr:TonB-dependent receptor [Bacteroidota bacterium]
MIRIIFLLVFLSAFNAFSQTVTVVNSETGEPAVNVAIYNKSKKLSTYTNIDGKARLDKFDLDENLYFQAISYLTIRLTKNQIIAN